MRDKKNPLCLLTACIAVALVSDSAVAMESLVDAARREAERRNKIEQLGIEEKVIEGHGACSSREGNVSIFSSIEVQTENPEPVSSSSTNRSSLRRYRAALKKMDQKIRKDEARLKKLEDRLQSLKERNRRIANPSKLGGNLESQNRTLEQIDNLRADLKQQRKERAEVYDSGKKDGFLPGELDGKGIMP